MRSYFLKKLCAFTLLVTPGLYGVPMKLTQKDVRPMFDEILNLHVEYKQFSPVLAKRSIKLFIEQFDPYKMYLLSSEVQPYLDVKDDRLLKIVDMFNKGNLAIYTGLNTVFQDAVSRARQLRAQVVNEILESSEEITFSRVEQYSSYPANVSELKARLKKQMLSILATEKRASSVNWTPAKKKRLFELWEKRFARSENSYLQTSGKELKEHQFALRILKSQSKSLDAHTTFFSPEEAYEMRASLEKQFEGVGIVLREGIDGISITNLVKGGPAERSGKVFAGDTLVEIDGKILDSLSYDEVLSSLKGERGSKVVLGVRHQGQDVKAGVDHIELVREKIVMQDERVQYSYESHGDGIIGKINLPSFYEGGGNSSCERDMREAIKGLKKKGDLLGVVIDMRENSGGFLSQAVKLAGLFISSGVIVISKYSKGEMQYLRDVDGRIYYDGPLVLLTSKASASAAEIVAQALQDYGIAVVVGDERTYGKGTIQYQTVTDDAAQNFFKVTVGRYYTVSGRSTQIEGVKADIVVPTEYSQYNIGERYLAYPLKNDQVAPAYSDQLADVDPKNKSWFQKNYLPNVQKKLSVWTQLMPKLKANSAKRISENRNFSFFLKTIKGDKSDGLSNDSEISSIDASIDLQMEEAVNVVKDMISMQKNMTASEN